jgi:hypothetical protein
MFGTLFLLLKITTFQGFFVFKTLDDSLFTPRSLQTEILTRSGPRGSFQLS